MMGRNAFTYCSIQRKKNVPFFLIDFLYDSMSIEISEGHHHVIMSPTFFFSPNFDLQ